MSIYAAPKPDLQRFTCPHDGCGAYTDHLSVGYQKAYYVETNGAAVGTEVRGLHIRQCRSCNSQTMWMDQQLIWPKGGFGPPPSNDMPDVVASTYRKAQSIFLDSPPASAAMLRLALEKLCTELAIDGDNLNAKIPNLVTKYGMPAKIQKAVDVVRIIGNKGVHPGEIDLDEDPDTALKMFRLLNLIVEYTITYDNEIEELFQTKLTDGEKAQIERRDARATGH